MVPLGGNTHGLSEKRPSKDQAQTKKSKTLTGRKKKRKGERLKKK